MLARRFSLVCLVMMLFGIGLSILVTEASRPARSVDAHETFTCLFEASPACGLVQR